MIDEVVKTNNRDHVRVLVSQPLTVYDSRVSVPDDGWIELSVDVKFVPDSRRDVRIVGAPSLSLAYLALEYVLTELADIAGVHSVLLNSSQMSVASMSAELVCGPALCERVWYRSGSQLASVDVLLSPNEVVQSHDCSVLTLVTKEGRSAVLISGSSPLARMLGSSILMERLFSDTVFWTNDDSTGQRVRAENVVHNLPELVRVGSLIGNSSYDMISQWAFSSNNALPLSR